MSADTLAIFGASPFVSIPSPHSVATSTHSGVSPSNSAEDFDFDLQGDDDEEHDAFASILGQSNSDASQNEDKNGEIKKRSRRPPSTAAKRATHNAVERARRESLNGRFMELANVLPNMSMSKRPSKNSIVEHAIEYALATGRRDRALKNENASLLDELNQLRARLGMAARPALVIDETPVGKPPSKRPSTVQTAPAKVATPTPVVAKVSNESVSPRTANAPAAVPQTVSLPAAQTFPTFDWSTAQFHGADVFNLQAYNPTPYGQNAQHTGNVFAPVFAWPSAGTDLGMPFAPAPTPGLA